jgi:2-keto-4-pentenoate hydratase
MRDAPVPAERRPPTAAAAMLWAAWMSGTRLEEIPADIRPVSIADGWAVQQQVGAWAGPRCGWKIAATSAAAQATLGLDRPLIGPLYEQFRHNTGAVLSLERLHMRMVEAELVFLIGRDVPAGAARATVLSCVSALHLGVEVPDSRFVNSAAAGGPSVTADAASAGMFVLGPEVAHWRAATLPALRTAIEIDGVTVATGTGSAVLGDPVTALTWLAAELAERGSGLRAGDLVTTGTTTPPPSVRPGAAVRAVFGSWGEVVLSFSP